MKKLILILLLISVLMVSQVSAISVISSSNIEFDSNNKLYDGNAFVVTGIENKGQDEIVWGIQNFENEIPDDYSMATTGTITSEFETYGWTYPIEAKAIDFRLKILDSKEFLFSSNAMDWCEDLGGNYVMSRSRLTNYACIKVYQGGYFFELEPGEYNYDVTYDFTIDGEGTDKIKLDETTSTGGKLIGTKNWFQAVVQTLGTSYRSDPDLNNDIILYYSLETSRWKTLQQSTPTLGFAYYDDYLEDCSKISFGDKALNCINEWNDQNSATINQYETSTQNLDYADVSTSDFSGSVKYDNGNIYRNPLVTLTINADKLIVKRGFGEAEFVEVSYPEEMTVGAKYPISIEIKNVGETDMDATLNLDCPDFSLSSVEQRIPIDSGKTVTEVGTIIYTGTVLGCETSDPCVLEVSNTNAVGVDDTYSFTSRVCRPSECSSIGVSECIGSSVRECISLNGAKVWKTTTVCETGCEMVDGSPMCINEPTKYKECTDGTFVLVDDECPTNDDNLIYYLIGAIVVMLLIILYIYKGKSGGSPADILG